jgi:hypothetical protein
MALVSRGQYFIRGHFGVLPLGAMLSEPFDCLLAFNALLDVGWD